MPVNTIPFVAYFKIVPERGDGKRFEIHRGREKIAHLVWRDLNSFLEDSINIGNNATGSGGPGGMNLAAPGAGIHWGLAYAPLGKDGTGALSNTMHGVAVKPQFGEFPDMLTVVGFYEDASGAIPYKEKQLISGGKVWTGPATGAPAYTNSTSPSTANQNTAKNLKADLETAITSVPADLVRLEVASVAYGWRGLHFPS